MQTSSPTHQPRSSSHMQTTNPQSSTIPKDQTPSKSRSRRRRPRKLNRDESKVTNSNQTTLENALQAEISALKTRVGEIESRIHVIQEQREDKKKQPRRRAKREKSGGTSEGADGNQEKEETELLNLSADLALARKNLSNANARLRVGLTGREDYKEPPTIDNNENDTEEIPRSLPNVRGSGLRRAMTISGSYNLPIPETVTDGEIQAVQKGLRSFQSIAKKYIDENDDTDARRDFQRTQSGTGWSSWIGGYTMSVARFVSNVRFDPAENNDENTESKGIGERPYLAPRSQTEPVVERRKPRKLRPRGSEQQRVITELGEPGASELLS